MTIELTPQETQTFHSLRMAGAMDEILKYGFLLGVEYAMKQAEQRSNNSVA